jgi:hypothetical protein
MPTTVLHQSAPVKTTPPALIFVFTFIDCLLILPLVSSRKAVYTLRTMDRNFKRPFLPVPLWIGILVRPGPVSRREGEAARPPGTCVPRPAGAQPSGPRGSPPEPGAHRVLGSRQRRGRGVAAGGGRRARWRALAPASCHRQRSDGLQSPRSRWKNVATSGDTEVKWT